MKINLKIQVPLHIASDRWSGVIEFSIYKCDGEDAITFNSSKFTFSPMPKI